MGVPTKELTADANSARSQSASAISAVTGYNNLPSPNKAIFANDQTGGPVSSAKGNLASIPNATANIYANDYASGVISSVLSGLGAISMGATAAISAYRRARGTDYHEGGLAIVNDEGGPIYRELITLPSGESFIPEGRNVMLPLPRGSKVLRASMTKKMFPHYKDGVG